MNIDKLIFDDKNFNLHTAEGMALIERSLREHGAGRSVLIDKDNRLIGGNGVVEAAKAVGINKVKVVEVEGDELVAVKRKDVSLDSQKGRAMALADNATAAADLAWDEEAIRAAEKELGIKAQDWLLSFDADLSNIHSGPRDNDKGFVKISLLFSKDEADEVATLCGGIAATMEEAILAALRHYGG